MTENEAFEAWAYSQGETLDCVDDETGRYYAEETEAAWAAWQARAAIAAVEIEKLRDDAHNYRSLQGKSDAKTETP